VILDNVPPQGEVVHDGDAIAAGRQLLERFEHWLVAFRGILDGRRETAGNAEEEQRGEDATTASGHMAWARGRLVNNGSVSPGALGGAPPRPGAAAPRCRAHLPSPARDRGLA